MIHQGKEKILLVEDSESDRFVYRRYLKADTENQYEILEAETLAEGLELWRSQSPNLALVDLHLPDGSGLELLEAITALPQDLQIPVIVMTGQGDEKIAVQTLKQGAIDYLVKGDITALTLCRAIRQGLDEGMFPRKVRQLQQQIEIQNSVLKFKDDLFQAIFDNTFQFTGLIAPDGTALEANQTALAVAGLKKEEVIGRPIWETEWFKISRQTQEKLRQSVARAAQGEFIRYEMDIWGANQRVIPIDFSLRPMFNESGEVIYIIPEGRDITDAKRLLIEREQALAALKVQKDFNQLIAEISSRFGEVTDETLDFEIDCSLQLIGEMSQVDTAYLFTLDRDRQTLSMSHEWSQSGSLRQIAIAQNVPFAAFPYSIALILRQQYCCVKDTALLPPEAAVDAAGWQQFNIKSLLSIPLIRNGQTIGMLGLASFSRAIAWDEESIRVLTILSQTIANTQARIEAENIRKQNEIELAEWRKRYELAEQASGQMVYEYNFLTNSVIWGANAKLILGYAESDLLLHLSDWMSLIHPEDLSIFQQALEIASIHQTPFFAQYRFRHQAGHYIWLEDRNQWLLNEQGEGIGVVGMIADISDQNKVELLLKKQALVFENITDGVIITDLDGIIIDWNRGAENLYGYTKTEMLGKSPSILHKTEEGQRLATEINQTTLQKGHWSGELIVVCKDGTEKITATSTVYLQDIQKNNIALIGFNHDITNLKKIEEELRDNNAKLQQFNQELEIRVEERTHALQVSEAFNRQLITEFPIGLACCRLDGQLVYVNPNFAKILGRTVEESLNLTYWDITPIKYQEQEAEQLRQLQETGSYGPYEKEYIHKDGHLVAVSLTGLLIQQKEETFIWSSVQDISDRKRMELKLQQSEEINRIILETIPDFLIHIDRQGNYIRKSKGQNVRVIELENDSLELNIHNVLSRDLAQQQLHFANLDLDSGTLQIFEQIVDFPDERRYEEVRIAPLNNQEVLMIIRDITERKQTEQTIRQQAEKETLLRQITQRIRESLNLQTIFDTACQEIRQFIQSDRVGIFRFYPESGFDDGEFVAESLKEGCSSVLAIRIHDHCFGEDYAKSYTEGHFQVINDVLQSNLQECHKAVLSQFQIRANLVIPLLCGQKLWGLLCIHTCTAPRIWQPDEIDLIQQIAGQLAIAIQQANLLEQLQQELKERQVTQQQLTERNQQLALSNEELARATRLKDEFLANMSHELRTPLNAILGMTEGLQEQVYGPINPKQLRSLQTIERSGFHLLGLINEILDLAKIESGQLELECGPTAIAPLCRSSLAFIKQQALNKRIQIQTQIPQDLPDIWIDERRIRQVLINLLNNAVKFTPEGGNVTLEATLAVNSAMASLVSDSSPSTQTCLRIAIVDNGIGITPENIPKLFQPFIQVDSALNRQYEGTGLGLALVKRLVELHGGRVSLTSEFGKGSCFTIDLPCPHRERFSSASSPELETENRTESISLQTRRSSSILLVEDNQASASTIVNYLEAKGYRLILAENGEKAIALAQSEKPDLILMDIQMPGMDGLEAIKQIRLNANLAQIPIIALTALAMPGDRDRCLEAGANEYVSKPVRLKQLTSLMQDLLNSSQD